MSEVELKGIVKFLLRHDNVQDVAFGARIYKMEDSSENFLTPEWQRNVMRSELHRRHCRETDDPRSMSYFYSVMNLVARKDNKNLAGLDNIEVDAKSSIKELLELVRNIESTNSEFYIKHRRQLLQVSNDLRDISDALRQHLHDHVKDQSEVAEHCMNYSFDDDTNFKNLTTPIPIVCVARNYFPHSIF